MAANKRIKNLTDDPSPATTDRVAVDGSTTRSTALSDLFSTAPTIIAIQESLAAAREAQTGGLLIYTTVAALNADLAHAAHTGAMVQGDPGGDSVDGYYTKAGASGAGSWSRTGPLIIDTLNDLIDALDTRLDTVEAADLINRLAAETRINVPRAVYLGDSVFQFNTLATAVTGTPISSLSIGEIVVCHALAPRFNIDTWADPTVALTFKEGADQGVASDTTALVIARKTDTSDQAPDIVFIACGINDLQTGVTAATVIANRKILTDYFTSRGALVIDFAIRPVSSAIFADGSSKLTDIVTINTALETYAATKTNCVFFDVYTAMNNGSGRPTTGWTTDGLHLSTLGAWSVGSSLFALIKRLIKPHLYLPPFAVGNLLTNPTFSGTGGTAGTRTTGSVADSYSVAMTSGTTVAVASSLLFNTDGSKRHRLTFTPGGVATVEHCLFKLAAGTVPISLDDKWVQLYAECVISSWPTGWRSFQLSISSFATANSPHDETVDTYPALPLEFTLITPAFKVTAGTLTLFPFLQVGVIGAAVGTGTFDIVRWWMGEVPEPLTPRNFI